MFGRPPVRPPQTGGMAVRPIRALTVAAVAGLGFATVPGAQAAVVEIMTEVGSNVDVSASGTINLAGFNHPGYEQYSSGPNGVIPSLGSILAGAPGTLTTDLYAPFSGPTAFGSGGFTQPSSGSGDRVGVRQDSPTTDFIVVPQGYVSGDHLSGTSVYVGATFASLGITPGTYVWSWGSGSDLDSLTLDVTESTPAVPEPASLGLLATALAGLFVKRRRKVA
jgi:PEP-CTERM motif